MSPVAKRIREKRLRLKFTQQEVAQKIFITQKSYSRLETGETAISVDTLCKICKALQCNLDDLLSLDDVD
jgi:transcriptional regulator with XRE-family HTH domain